MGFQDWLDLVWEGLEYIMVLFAIFYIICFIGMVIYGVSQFFDWIERRIGERETEIWEDLYRTQELNARQNYMTRQQYIMSEWNY